MNVGRTSELCKIIKYNQIILIGGVANHTGCPNITMEKVKWETSNMI